MMGLYTRNKIGLDDSKENLRDKYSIKDFQQQQISFYWNGSVYNNIENTDNNINQLTTNNVYFAVLNLARFNEGSTQHEINLKLRNNIMTGDFKLA